MAFADPDCQGQTIGDLGRADTDITMEDAIEGLLLVATIIGIAGLTSAEIANIAGCPAVGQYRWRVGNRGGEPQS